MQQQFFPFNVQSHWIPDPQSESFQMFLKLVLEAEKKPWAPCIENFKKEVEGNPTLKYLFEKAFRENQNIIDAHQTSTEAPIPRIPDLDTMLHAFNTILSMPPQFINNDLVALPFSALIVGIDATLSGSVLLRLPEINILLKAILKEWSKFLESPASAEVFMIDGKQWLSETAKEQYEFYAWQQDNPGKFPVWNSWDSFFTRNFLDKSNQRPIADPKSNQVVICPNDGSLFCWQPQVKKRDVFWLKGMPYSLEDIFSSPDKEQNEKIKALGLADMFEGGYVFQTYLNPYNFHRWWVPVNGTVLFEPIVISDSYFSKLVLPDYGGATTESLPYLAEANTRGLIVFETKDYGKVCCIPLGMSEVSSVKFDPEMKEGAKVKKGDEMGKFHYGGSSFVVIYQNLPNKQLVFVNDSGDYFPQQPPSATSSSGSGSYNTDIGSQIGIWYSR